MIQYNISFRQIKKLALILLVFSSLTIKAQSGTHSFEGQIIALDNGEFQLEYPEQLMNVYFGIKPYGAAFKDKLSGLVFNAVEKRIFMHKIMSVIDELPAAFRAKYLGIDIFFLTINGEESGFYYSNQIVIESSDFKRSKRVGSLEQTFAHELGHHIYSRIEDRRETKLFIQYLEQFRKAHLAYTSDNNHADFKKRGYYSGYSYNRFGSTYKATEEFADLLGSFIAERDSLLSYLLNGTYPLFVEKINRTNEFLKQILPSLAINFDTPNGEICKDENNPYYTSIAKKQPASGPSLAINGAEQENKNSTTAMATIVSNPSSEPHFTDSNINNDLKEDPKLSARNKTEEKKALSDMEYRAAYEWTENQKNKKTEKQEKKKKRKRNNKDSAVLGILVTLAVTLAIEHDAVNDIIDAFK